MKKMLLAILVLLPLTGLLRAQTPPIIGPANIANTLYAANFAGWTVAQGQNGPFSWSSSAVCTSAVSGGVTFKPFVVGSPIRIYDTASPSNSENVTVTAVSIIGSGCSITTTTPAHTHFSFFLGSATAGLQEAINYSKQSFGTQNPASLVITTPAWSIAGGTTGTITSALGSSTISILDERTACPVAYIWGGSSYSGTDLCSGGGSPTVVEVNGTPISPASPADFVDTASVTWDFTGGQIKATASGGGGGGCSVGGIPTTGGIVDGDTSSTNCGTDNRASDTATSPADVQTFGFTNLTGNSGQFIVAEGNNNAIGNTASDVVAIGDSTLGSNTSSSTNSSSLIAIGNQAMALLSGSSPLDDLIGIGDGAANKIDSSNDFVVIGDGAGSNYTGSSDVVALGDGAGSPASTAVVANDVVAIGDGAGANGKGGSDLISIGDASGAWLGASSSDVVAIGDGAVRENTSGANSNTSVTDVIGIGDAAGKSNIGSEIIAIGTYNLGAGQFSHSATGNSGNNNIAIGEYTLAMNLTGTRNVAVGDYAGCDGFVYPGTLGNCNTSGSNNVWLGYDAGPNTTSQLSNTVAVGYQARNTASNQAVLGNSSMTDTELFGTTHVNGAAGVAGGFQLVQGTPTSPLVDNVGIFAPASVTAYNLFMPGAQGTGALTNDGSGNLSWVPGGGSDACTGTDALASCLSVGRKQLAQYFQSLHNSQRSFYSIKVPGDSLQNCWGFGGSNFNCSQAVGPSISTNRQIDKFRIDLQNQYGYHGTGYNGVISDVAGPTVDKDFWSISGAIVTDTSLGPFQGSVGSTVVLSSGETLTYSTLGTTTGVPFPGDTLYVGCEIKSGGDTITVTVDTVVQGSTACGSGATSPQMVQFTGFANTPHTVVFSATSGGTVRINGAGWTSGTTGVDVTNAAVGSSTSQWFGGSPSTNFAFLDLWEPANTILIIDAYGGDNDSQTGVTPTQFATATDALITDQLALTPAPSIALVTTPITAVSGAATNFPLYAAQQATLVATYDLGFIQPTDQWGTTYSNANLLFTTTGPFTGLHYTSKGALSMNAMYEALLLDNATPWNPSIIGGVQLKVNRTGSQFFSGYAFDARGDGTIASGCGHFSEDQTLGGMYFCSIGPNNGNYSSGAYFNGSPNWVMEGTLGTILGLQTGSGTALDVYSASGTPGGTASLTFLGEMPQTGGWIVPRVAVYGWNNGAGLSPDTGISRDAADVIDLGNGTAGDRSAGLQAKWAGFNGSGAALIANVFNIQDITGTAYLDSLGPDNSTIGIVDIRGITANAGTIDPYLVMNPTTATFAHKVVAPDITDSALAGGGTQCVDVDNTGNFGVTGSACGSGGGGSAFSAITGSTNTTAAMVVGSGASMATTGTGTNQATIVASSETVSFSATPTFSTTTAYSEITLTGNITSFTLGSGTAGQGKTLTFCQDGTGGRTIAGVPANLHGFFSSLLTTASKCSSQHYNYSTAQTAWLADSAGVTGE